MTEFDVHISPVRSSSRPHVHMHGDRPARRRARLVLGHREHLVASVADISEGVLDFAVAVVSGIVRGT